MNRKQRNDNKIIMKVLIVGLRTKKIENIIMKISENNNRIINSLLANTINRLKKYQKTLIKDINKIYKRTKK